MKKPGSIRIRIRNTAFKPVFLSLTNCFSSSSNFFDRDEKLKAARDKLEKYRKKKLSSSKDDNGQQVSSLFGSWSFFGRLLKLLLGLSQYFCRMILIPKAINKGSFFYSKWALSPGFLKRGTWHLFILMNLLIILNLF